MNQGSPFFFPHKHTYSAFVNYFKRLAIFVNNTYPTPTGRVVTQKGRRTILGSTELGTDRVTGTQKLLVKFC
jgi:hypothetical protein